MLKLHVPPQQPIPIDNILLSCLNGPVAFSYNVLGNRLLLPPLAKTLGYLRVRYLTFFIIWKSKFPKLITDTLFYQGGKKSLHHGACDRYHGWPLRPVDTLHYIRASVKFWPQRQFSMQRPLIASFSSCRKCSTKRSGTSSQWTETGTGKAPAAADPWAEKTKARGDGMRSFRTAPNLTTKLTLSTSNFWKHDQCTKGVLKPFTKLVQNN